jgi:hypothetical protein
MGLNQAFKRKMRELEKSINVSIKKAVNSNSDILEDQQTEGQFDKGKDSFNISLVPSYANSTKRTKRSKGQPTNRVTLKDAGELYKSVKVEGTSNQIVISANVEHFKYLVAHYKNNSLLGIQPKAMKDFTDKYICKEIVENFNKIISK